MTLINLQKRIAMKYFNTLAAATLIAASSCVSAADLRDNVVVSAGSYVELPVMAGVIAGAQTSVTETRGTGKFTGQSLAVQLSMHMPQSVAVVGDEHGELRAHLKLALETANGEGQPDSAVAAPAPAIRDRGAPATLRGQARVKRCVLRRFFL